MKKWNPKFMAQVVTRDGKYFVWVYTPLVGKLCPAASERSTNSTFWRMKIYLNRRRVHSNFREPGKEGFWRMPERVCRPSSFAHVDAPA